MKLIVISRAIVAAVAAGAVVAGGVAASSALSVRPASRTAAVGLTVVASTDVYGDIVRQIAGSQVPVTAFIGNPTQDPHTYQATARDELALSRARLVIENGGGYDDFVDVLLDNHHAAGQTVLNAVDISGKQRVDGSVNEHVWYDFPTVRKLVARVSDALAGAQPASAATFRSNAARLDAELVRLEQTAARIRSSAAGSSVLTTEPVARYLLDACGLIDRTPAEFSDAVEAGTDAPPRAVARTLQFTRDQQVRLVVYNEQTVDRDTTRLLRAAREERVPVVAVTETLPSGLNYVSWMAANLAAIEKALSAT